MTGSVPSPWKLLLLALAVLAGILFAVQHKGAAAAADRDEAAAVGRASVETVLSYASRTVAADLKASEKLLAEPFRSEFKKLEPNIIKKAKDRRISTSAVVSAVGTEGLPDDGEVVLLVFVNQNTSAGNSPRPVQQGSRIRVTMTSRNGTWLISDLKPL